MTYGAGVSLSMDTYPDFLREKDTQKKKFLNVQCPWFGCFTKGHVSTKAKKCQYHGSLIKMIRNYNKKFMLT